MEDGYDYHTRKEKRGGNHAVSTAVEETAQISMKPMQAWEWVASIFLIGLGIVALFVLTVDASTGAVPPHVAGAIDSDRGFVAACYQNDGRYLYYDRGDQAWQHAEITISCVGGTAAIEVVLREQVVYLPSIGQSRTPD